MHRWLVTMHGPQQQGQPQAKALSACGQVHLQDCLLSVRNKKRKCVGLLMVTLMATDTES